MQLKAKNKTKSDNRIRWYNMKKCTTGIFDFSMIYYITIESIAHITLELL